MELEEKVKDKVNRHAGCLTAAFLTKSLNNKASLWMVGLVLGHVSYSNTNLSHFFTDKSLNKHEHYKLNFACAGEKSGDPPAVH